MVQVPSSTSAAHAKSHVEVDAFDVDVSVSGALAIVELHQDVELVSAVRNDTPA